MFGKSKKPLFGNRIVPACIYCTHCYEENGLHCNLGNHPACRKDESCRRFVYNPLERIPHKAPPLPKVNPEDFTL